MPGARRRAHKSPSVAARTQVRRPGAAAPAAGPGRERGPARPRPASVQGRGHGPPQDHDHQHQLAAQAGEKRPVPVLLVRRSPMPPKLAAAVGAGHLSSRVAAPAAPPRRGRGPTGARPGRRPDQRQCPMNITTPITIRTPKEISTMALIGPGSASRRRHGGILRGLPGCMVTPSFGASPCDEHERQRHDGDSNHRDTDRFHGHDRPRWAGSRRE